MREIETMYETRTTLRAFLRACAAGGAMAPTFALVVHDRGCELDAAALCRVANEMINLIPDADDAIRFVIEADGATVNFTSVNGTRVLLTDCGPYITDADGAEVAVSNYRERAAARGLPDVELHTW